MFSSTVLRFTFCSCQFFKVLDGTPARYGLDVSRFMAVRTKLSVEVILLTATFWDGVCNLPATDPNLYISSYLDLLIWSLCFRSFSAPWPGEKSQHTQPQRGKSGGRLHGTQYCRNRKFLRSAGMFKSLHIWSVQPANHRADAQPDYSATGGNK